MCPTVTEQLGMKGSTWKNYGKPNMLKVVLIEVASVFLMRRDKSQTIIFMRAGTYFLFRIISLVLGTSPNIYSMDRSQNYVEKRSLCYSKERSMFGSSLSTPYNYSLILEGMMNLSSIWKTLVYRNYKESHIDNLNIYNSFFFKFSTYEFKIDWITFNVFCCGFQW